MYPVSDAFLLEVKQNTRKYHWTGRVTANGGAVYDFDQDNYLVADGKHDAIIDEDTWNKAREKRKETGIKWNKVHDLGREHLLSGILKCPVCGASLAGTVQRKKYPSGKVNSIFYYRCLHCKRIDGTAGNAISSLR